MKKLLAVAFNLVIFSFSAVSGAGECGADSDCKTDRLCYEGECMSPDLVEALEKKRLDALEEAETHEAGKPEENPIHTSAAPLPRDDSRSDSSTAIDPSPELREGDARLVVWLDPEHKGEKGVIVYVNGKPVGPAPWKGIVKSGRYRILVKGGGWWSKTVSTKIWPGKTRVIEMKLRPEGRFDTGVFRIGHGFQFGIGMQTKNGDRERMGAMTLPTLDVGFNLPSKKVWWELFLKFRPEGIGANLMTGSDISFNWLVATRVLLPLDPPWIFLSLNLGAGFGWVVNDDIPRGILEGGVGFSFFLGDYFEFWLNPVYGSFQFADVEDQGDHGMEGGFWTGYLYYPGVGFNVLI